MNPDKPRYPQTPIPPELAEAVAALAADGKHIPCEKARGLAAARGLDTRFIGYIIDELGLRIIDCGLGCF